MDKKNESSHRPFYLSEYILLSTKFKESLFSSNSSSWSLKTDDFMVKRHLENYNGSIVN